MMHLTRVCPKCLIAPLSTDSPMWKCPDCKTVWEEEDLSPKAVFY